MGLKYKRIFQAGLSVLLGFCLVLNCFCNPVQALTQEQRLVVEAWRIVNRSYLDDSFNHQSWSNVRKKALKQPLNDYESAYKAIRKMLEGLDDPFTRFLDPQQYRSLKVNTSGELTGVGLQIALNSKTGKLEVVTPIDGSPADKAGIKPHDRILEIEGISTDKLSLDEAANRMRGSIGSLITLLIQTDQEVAKEVRLTRDRIELNPVIAELRSSSEGMLFGYIRLTQFNANASSELNTAISSLEKKGAEAYILDLRNNPGGLLQAGVEVARMWLDDGTIVYTVNRQGIQGSFDAKGTAITKAPLVVLVNEGTASASEILAGALQDNKRALLVGTTTFGKGLIQSLFELFNGSGIAVTIAKYETPNHRDINKQGIKPDKIIVSEPMLREDVATDKDTQYQAALKILASQNSRVNIKS
ncbi:MAG: carboxyl-terminal processing protease CtpA [Cyanobacteria bacterium P01_A01_bin.45]